MKKQLFYAIVFTFLTGCLLLSCTNNSKKDQNTKVAVPDVKVENTPPPTPAPPHCRLLMQPYGGFSQARAQSVADELKKTLATYVKDPIVIDVKVLPAKPLTRNLMNNDKTRYRADKILSMQMNLKSQKDDMIIGLTDKDISATLHGYDDWGVIGLSKTGLSNSVLSTFRVKDKSQFWKVVLHEFGHAYLGLPHCPNDDPHCFMKDCNGKPDLAKERYLCDSCSNRIHL